MPVVIVLPNVVIVLPDGIASANGGGGFPTVDPQYGWPASIWLCISSICFLCMAVITAICDIILSSSCTVVCAMAVSIICLIPAFAARSVATSCSSFCSLSWNLVAWFSIPASYRKSRCASSISYLSRNYIRMRCSVLRWFTGNLFQRVQSLSNCHIFLMTMYLVSIQSSPVYVTLSCMSDSVSSPSVRESNKYSICWVVSHGSLRLFLIVSHSSGSAGYVFVRWSKNCNKVTPL